jgi:transposase, IS30 family
MMKYNRLSDFERDLIGKMLYAGKSKRFIASELMRSPSTVSREVKKYSSTFWYVSSIAQAESEARAGRRNFRRKIDKDSRLWLFIQEKLKLCWSPDQISKELRKKYPVEKVMQISPESIYTHLYILPRGELKKELIGYLRQKKKLRKNRKLSVDKRGAIPDMISIEERPPEVADRSVPGHWEGDLIMGKDHQSALGTIVERTTRTVVLVPLKDKDATSVRKAFAKEMKIFPEQMTLSLTYDQGKEMAEHKLFTRDTKIKVYFCHPSSPWERGTNENTNGLIRQFFPKGTDFGKVSKEEIKKVQNMLNERPRAVNNYDTPKERMALLLR